MNFVAALGCLARKLVRATSLAMAVLALMSFIASEQVKAQQADGVIGWVSDPATNPAGPFSSAYDACHAQWNFFMNNGYSRFIGAQQHSDNWTLADCQWTQYQYLCPQETGGGFACGTIYPNGVYFKCQSGYTPTADGHCRLNPAPECPTCNAGRDNPTVGNPIVLGTGAKLLEAQDYASADGQFAIGRLYRSLQVGRPIVGTALPRSQPRGLIGGWNFNFGHEIQLGSFSGSPASPSAEVAVLLPDGTGYGFILQSNGQWTMDPAIGAGYLRSDLTLQFVGTLPNDISTIPNATSTWKFTDQDDNVWTLQTRLKPNGSSYNTGWVTQKVARSGYTQNFAYNSDSSLASITDSFGRVATLSWNMYYMTTLATPPAGALPYPLAVASITLPDNTLVQYTYSPVPALSAPSTSMIKQLVKVARVSTTGAVVDSTSYLYEDTRFPTHVTGIIDNRGIRTRTYAYDPEGRATLTQLADGYGMNQVQFGTNGTAQTARVINPLGKAIDYTFSQFDAPTADYRITGVAGEASANTPASSASQTYGTNTYINGRTDAEGRPVTMTRDARGRPLTIIEGAGSDQRTTTITWSSAYNVPVTIVRPGVTETRTLDAQGRITAISLTDTTSQTVPYSTAGQVRTYGFSWDANGRLLSVNGPLPVNAQNKDDITSYTYDTAGRLLTVTNPLSQVTTYGSYDANGRPGTVKDANGITTAYTYDPLGRLTTIVQQNPTNSSLNATTTLAYDAAGELIQVTLPSTDMIYLDYDDAGRITSMRAASGERQNFVYDTAGNVISETTLRSDGTQSRQTTSAFDELSRVISVTTGLGHTARTGYDRTDNVVSTVAPSGVTTSSTLDTISRVTQVMAPDGGTTTTAYNGQDKVVSNVDPISVTTTFVYNGFGDVIREVSPDRGTNTYWYDLAGGLVQSSDGRGQVITYTRDLLERVTTKVPTGRPASDTVTYTWDTGGITGSYQVGRLGNIADGSGSTLFQYDHRGNTLAKQVTITGLGTTTLSYSYDLANRITQITYPSGRLVRYTYDTKGRVSAVDTKASSSITTWTSLASGMAYEPFAALTTATFGNGLSAASSWGNDGRLASKRLYTTSTSTNKSYLLYSNDANDNIAAISDQVGTAGSVVYGYDKVDRLNAAFANGSGTVGSQTYAYTTGTNKLSTVTTSAGARNIAYDARGNTATETRPGSISATTGYDGYARLISYSRTDVGALTFTYNALDDRVKMVLPAKTRYFVYDGDGRVMGEYGTSAADVRAEFIWMSPSAANDNAWGGTDGASGYMPLAVATPNSGGTIQLNWVYGNHLGVPLLTTDSTGAAATTPNDYFAPGFPGQSRVLTDLYYNRYRDYDPNTGRYIQADPIGLVGGWNDYVYVGNNPISFTDPMGTGPTGASVGGAIGGALGAIGGDAACAETGPFALICGAGGRAGGRAIGAAIGSAIEGCRDHDECELERQKEEQYCSRKFSPVKEAVGRCFRRAEENYLNCRRGRPGLPWWTDRDEDGAPPLPRPPRRR